MQQDSLISYSSSLLLITHTHTKRSPKSKAAAYFFSCFGPKNGSNHVAIFQLCVYKPCCGLEETTIASMPSPKAQTQAIVSTFLHSTLFKIILSKLNCFCYLQVQNQSHSCKEGIKFFSDFFFFVVSFWFETLFNYFFGVFIYRLRRQRFKLRMVFLEPQEALVSQSRMSSLLVVLL